MYTLLNNQSFFLQPGDVYQIDLGLTDEAPHDDWYVAANGGAVDIRDWFDFDGSFLSINAPDDLYSNSTYYAGESLWSRTGHDYEHMDLNLTFYTAAGDYVSDNFSVSITPMTSSNSASDREDAFFLDYTHNEDTAWLEDGALLINSSEEDVSFGGLSIGAGADLIIIEGGGYDVVRGNVSENALNWPNYEMSDTDTFVVGGATGTVDLRDYDEGEEIILLSYGSDVTVDTYYDWASDTTSLTIYGDNLVNDGLDAAEGLSDRIINSGNFAIDTLQQGLTFENEFRDQAYHDGIDTSITLIATNEVPFESIALGADADVFFGDGGAQYVKTGGGDDVIKTLSGDDYVLVEGQGDVTIDVGDGSDVVEVESDFVGDISIANGAGGDFDPSTLMVMINKEIGRSGLINENDLRIGFNGSDDEIIIEGYYTTDDQGYTTIAGTTVLMEGWGDPEGIDVWNGGYTDSIFDWSAGTDGQDQFYSSALLTGEVDEEVIYILSGRDGDDVIHSGGGTNLLFGGDGDDIFYVSGDTQLTSIVADVETTIDEQYINPSLNEYGLPNYGTAAGTTNTNYADKVYIDWVYDSDSIAEISGANGQGVVVWNDDLGARVEIYDAEELIFKLSEDDEGNVIWDAGISIGETAVVGTGTDPEDPLSWKNGHHGKSFSYSDDNIRFVLTDKPAADGGGDAPSASPNGDATSDWLQVYATATTTETYTYYEDSKGRTRSSPKKGYDAKTGTRETEEEA
ncbi:hypothetical protein N9I56_07215, partial [Alphaproteobacteria bacterium]|nr:hypothetical protein [Alphaproteobacteria bacterium]